MLKFHASAYMDLCSTLATIEKLVSDLTGPTRDEIAKQSYAGGSLFDDLREACQTIGLAVSLAQVERIVSSIEAQSITYVDLGVLVKDLRFRIYDEADTQLFLHVPQQRSRYFTKSNLFGERVMKHFPNAIKDVDEAGKCLGVGRGTATVFHLMRVMEELLKYLAGRLSIPYAPSWESYITQISKQIAEQRSHKTVDWKRDEAFFKEVLGDLVAIKTAWRNPTMHIVRHYDPEEAENIFRTVKVFSHRLAENADKTNALLETGLDEQAIQTENGV